MKKQLVSATLALIIATIGLVGCGSSGDQKVLGFRETPEAAYTRITNSIRKSNQGLTFAEIDGKYVRKAEGDINSDSNENEPSVASKTITLYDLDNATYSLYLKEYNADGTNANFLCTYSYKEANTNYALELNFKLIYDEEAWWLDDVLVTDKTTVDPIDPVDPVDPVDPGQKPTYYISGKVSSGTADKPGDPISNALVQAFPSSNIQLCVAETFTNSEGYYTLDLTQGGEYLIVVTKDRYESVTFRETAVERSLQ